MIKSVNVKKTKKFKENRPENYHVHDTNENILFNLLRSRLHDPR